MTANKGIDWDAQPLGQVVDAELARRLGCNSTTVNRARQLRGIEPYKPTTSMLDESLRRIQTKDDDAEPDTLRSGRAPDLKKYGESDVRRIFFIPDSHRPYHDPLAYRTMLTAARHVAALPGGIHTLVILGDYADFYCVSSHSQNPSRRTLLELEVCDVLDGLDELDALPGVQRKVYVEGNHEWRLARYLADKAPELFGLVDVPGLLGLEKRGWEFVPYKRAIKLGKLLVTHDVDRAGKYALQHSLADAGTNIVIGHTHRMGTWYEGSATGTSHVAASFGWLGSVDEANYKHRMKALRDWHHGFGIGYQEECGTVHIQAVPIIEGRCVVEGQVIRAAGA